MSKIIVITGASSGIGKCTAQMFRAKGETVVNVSREIDVDYPDLSYVCDVSNEELVKQTFSKIGERFGKIDVLINNAGFGVSGALELVPTETFKSIMDVNLFGVYYCSKYALPYMSAGAKIINISSALGIWSVPFRGMYCTSKAAVLSFTYAQRLELNEAGIDVCAICPGDVKSNFSKNRVRNFDTNCRYGNRIQKAVGFVDKHESKRMPPEVVAKAILKQTYKRKSKPMVIVSRKYNVCHFLLRFFPTSFELFMINKIFGGGKLEQDNSASTVQSENVETENNQQN